MRLHVASPAITAAVLLTMQGTASAEPLSYEPLVVSRTPIKDLAPRRVWQMFADCMVAQRAFRQRVEEFLVRVPDDQETKSAGRTMVSAECVPVDYSGKIYGLNADVPTLRGALYEALYRSDFGTIQSSAFTNLAALDVNAEFRIGKVAPSDVTRLTRQFADCVSVSAPQAVHELLKTEAASAEERAKLGAVSAILDQCLGQGGTLTFDKTSLRSILAEAMYKRAAGKVQFAAANSGSVH